MDATDSSESQWISVTSHDFTFGKSETFSHQCEDPKPHILSSVSQLNGATSDRSAKLQATRKTNNGIKLRWFQGRKLYTIQMKMKRHLCKCCAGYICCWYQNVWIPNHISIKNRFLRDDLRKWNCFARYWSETPAKWRSILLHFQLDGSWIARDGGSKGGYVWPATDG